MKSYIKIGIIYFPIILILAQVLANLIYLFAPSFYISIAFYANLLVGTNVLFTLFLVGFTFYFKFCEISRTAALAELAFVVNYLIVQEDSLYNILFQIIVGTFAIIATIIRFTKLYPKCKVSLIKNFFILVIKERSCNKAFEKWEI